MAVRSAVSNENSFWVLYAQHERPTFLENAGDGQAAQRNSALRYVTQWRNCLDIGSNIGQWTRPLAKLFKKVYCFEPNPNFRECFTRNIDFDNVELCPYGLSNKRHQAQQEFNSTVLKMGEGAVECRTLDSFQITNVDFIKIDVDGFEVPLLEGACDTLTKNTPVVNIEMKRDKRPSTVKRAEEILIDLGYRYENRTKSDEVWLRY